MSITSKTVLILLATLLLAGYLKAQVVTSGGSSIPIAGQFQSSLDPPLFQNYSLTTAGAQTAINLTTTPIDSHTISWRPFGATAPLIDTFAYSNGDLHTANANWIYQSGTFTIASNVAYGNAALSFAYRSDGVNQANEFAQETVVETSNAGAQNHGPCVRMSTVAQTAYCIQTGNNQTRLVYINAGAFTTLTNFDTQPPITGDVIQITAIGTTLTFYKNNILIGTAIDSNLTTGETGMYSTGAATVNGASNFQSGTPYGCTVALDSSPDGTTWTAGGLIPAQPCNVAGSIQVSNPATANGTIANYVRVNLTAINTGTVAIVYSGRLAPTTIGNGVVPVSNAQWVQAGQILWAQYTTQGSVNGVSTVGLHQSVNILSPTNKVLTTTWDVPTCGLSAGGVGTGFVVAQSGWLQGFTAYMTTGGFPQGSVLLNMYILNSMPAAGGLTTCVNALLSSNIGTILGTWPTGSFLPVSFVGTTPFFTSVWSIPGYTSTLTQANPSAGAEWTWTAPTTARTCVQSVSFTAVAGSTGINPVLVFTVNGSKLVYAPATQQASGTTQSYSFSPGAASEVVTGGSTLFHVVPFNNGQMVCFNSGLATGTVGTLTTTINGTTQYSNISLLVQIQQDNN